MRVYLAGPMRGLPEFNFPAFDAGDATLTALGHVVFSPAERDRRKGFKTEGLTGHENLAKLGFDLRKALAADTAYIAQYANAVALLPGWQKSAGVAAEVALAHALGLPVGELADFDEDGPHTTLEAPHGSSGSVPKPGDAEEILTARAAGFYADGQALGRVAFAKDEWPAPPHLTQAEAQHIADLINAGAEQAVPTGEVRTTSATGGEKGTKPERYDLIPVGALAKIAQLYGRGAAKYAAHNWRRGYEWSKSYAALQRHATQFWNGEDNDPEMDLPHMASVAFHALALLTFMEEQPGFDDRYKPEPAECCGENAACSACYTNDLGARS